MTHYNLSNINHWEYGPCDYNETNDDEINNLVYEYNFPQSACIKKYYSLSKKKYLNIGESGFKWPILAYGASNPNRTIYGIIIEKCHNDSLKNNCKSIEEINNYLNKYAITLNIVDQYVDVLDYERPYTKYIYSLTNGLYSGSISFNNLYFNPSLTKTHKSFFFDHIIEEKSYTYSQDVKLTISPGDTNIIVAFFFWMQNIMIYNERSYKKIQDILSDIGGFGSFVLLLALGINYLVTGYIILLDTEELVLNIDRINYDKNKYFKRPPIYKKASEILHPPKLKNYANKRKNNNNQQQNSLYPILIKENNNIYNTNISDPIKSLFSKNNKKEIIKDNNNSISKNNKKTKFSSPIIYINNKNFLRDKKLNQNDKIELYGENLSFKKLNFNKNCYEIKDNKSEKSIKSIKNDNTIKSIRKNKFTWLNYFYYFLSFKNCNNKIKFYEDFRAQIISEENLLQNYSDIFKLLKICNIERPDPFILFKEGSNSYNIFNQPF